VHTIPGVPCIAGVKVMSWSDHGVTGDPHRSWLESESLIANSAWQILYQDGGSSDAFNPAMDVQRAAAPVFRNTYDHFEEIAVAFTPTSFQTTVFFENVRLWPFHSNDNYVDDAYMYCGDGLEAPAPPADPPPAPDNAPPPAVNDPLVTEELGKYRAFNSQYIRADHCTSNTKCPIVGGLGTNQQTKYWAKWTKPENGDVWLCLDEGRKWVTNPQFPSINILACGEWAALTNNGVALGTTTLGH
jgi:hypothetical protein